MRAAILTGPGRAEVVQVPRPEPGPGEVRVRLEGCGVCASNLTPWAGPDWMTFPTEPGALGHEGWGIVDAIGPGVSGVREGQRVAALSYKAYAEYDLAEADTVVPLPDALDGQAFPGEPLGCAFNIFRRSGIEAGQTVGIVGIGFLGAILTRLATDEGARVIAISRRPFSLDLARRMGAAEIIPMEDHGGIIARVKDLTGGRFCERVIEAVGKQWPLDLAAEITAERGRLVVAGYHQDGPRQVNMWLWNWRGLDVVNAHERDPAVYLQGMREAVDAVASGRLDAAPLVTNSFPLERLGEALDATRDRPEGFLKAAVAFVSRGKPRVGFLGVGWIGRHRMEAMLASGLIEAVAVADPSPAAAAEAAALAPGARAVDTLDELLAAKPDGIVIATPSALHAGQAVRALEAGAAVFCQKPLGRTAAETRAVVDAARKADRLLGVDLSYRFTEPMRRIREVVRAGELGKIFAADLVFHNAYGPDKPWFYDPEQSGGGCAVDLGVHLVDLALWLLDGPAVLDVSASLFAGGEPLGSRRDTVEDYAVATLTLATGTVVRLACSWRLPAGRDAVISVALHGTAGGAAMNNVGGSFYDFVGERYRGTATEMLAGPPDAWGGRAAVDWARRLAAGERSSAETDEYTAVVAVLDRIYGR